MYTVKTLKDQLEKLIAQGLGDRVVVSSVYDNEDEYDGDYALVSEVDTQDYRELVVYLECYSPLDDSALWDEFEAKTKKRG
jgi:hypothetical protein